VGERQEANMMLANLPTLAPPKINEDRRILEGDDVIPATIYEPSDSSDDFQVQVNKVMEGCEESSKRREGSWLARCEMMHELSEREAMETDKGDESIKDVMAGKGG
jgi:hypothetical protein